MELRDICRGHFAVGIHDLTRYFPGFSMAKQSMSDNDPRSLSKIKIQGYACFWVGGKDLLKVTIYQWTVKLALTHGSEDVLTATSFHQTETVIKEDLIMLESKYRMVSPASVVIIIS
jgi:hypothetical protein